MNKTIKILLVILCVVCLGVFLFSGYKLFSKLSEYKAAQKSYEDLQRTLRDKGLADVEVTVTKQTSSPTVAHKRPLSGFCVYRTFNFARSIYSSKRSGSTICAK